eukprot:scaffold14708_cov207-Ochromonas_danica.AAC.1
MSKRREWKRLTDLAQLCVRGPPSWAPGPMSGPSRAGDGLGTRCGPRMHTVGRTQSIIPARIQSINTKTKQVAAVPVAGKESRKSV